MVVDDEIDICNFIKAFFEMRGFQVSFALNADEAQRRILEERPAVLILDVMMRGAAEGMRCLPLIRNQHPDLKIIVVTGLDDNETVKLAVQLGADDFIHKPLVLEYLETTVLEKVKYLKQAQTNS